MSPIASRNGGNDSRTLHVNRGGAPARQPDPPEAFTDRLGEPEDLLARLFAEQSRSWQEGRGTPAEDLLARHPEFARSADAFLLVYNEFLLREELGQKPDVDEFDWRFPAYAAQIREQLRIRRVRSVAMSHGGTRVGVSSAGEERRPASAGPTEPLPTVTGYEILSALGRGGMGMVYKARQIGLNRIVALKMIRGGPFADPEFQARFRVEAEAVARMQHPNIVHIYEIGTTTSALGLGYPFISLEFVDGGDLAGHLRRAPQPPTKATALLETLARAVHYAHENGIAHRDLKPANILLTNDGTPKIADFGLAKHLATSTGAMASGPTLDGTVVGTPEYMAPEQAAGRKDVGTAADVYALGVILYEMLTGRCPFEGASPVDTMDLVRKQEPLPPRRLVPRIPRDLETICLKCLEKDPARRYPSARELADDLRRFHDGDPVRARPVGPAERLRRWARKHPAVAGLLAGLVAVTAVGPLTVLWQWRSAVAARATAEANARDALTARDDANEREAEAKAARADAETNLYFGQIAQASLHWRLNNVGDAANVLDLCPPGRRGWEWSYLRGLHAASLLTLRDNGRSWVHVQSLAYSPDGARLAIAAGSPYQANGGYGEMSVWDARSGQRLLTLPAPPAMCDVIAFSPDGKRLASGCRDGTVRVYNAATGRELRAMKGHRGEVMGLAWSPDGKRIAAGDNSHRLRVWEPESGRLLTDVKTRDAVYSVAYSADSRHLVLGCQVHGWMCDAATGLEPPERPGLPGGAVFSPDGKLLAGTRGGRVEVVDFATRKVVQTIVGHDGNVIAVAFSPDGLAIATAGADSTVRLWDVASGAERLLLRGHAKRVGCVAFHPSGRVLASGGHQPGDVKVWDLTRQQEHATVLWDEPFRFPCGVSFLGDSTQVAVACPGSVRVRDAACGTLRQRFFAAMCNDWLTPAKKCAFSADGHVMAGMSEDRRGVGVWDVPDGRQTGALTGHTVPVIHVAVSGDGKRVATGALGPGVNTPVREVRVWDRETGKILVEYRGVAPVVLPFHGGVALSGDGRRVAFEVCTLEPVGDDRVRARFRVKVFEVDTRQELSEVVGLNSLPTTVALSADGRHVAAADATGQVIVCDAATGRRLHERALRGPNSDLAFSPDGRCLAGVDRELVKVWSVASGQEVLTLRGAPPRAGDGGFNPHIAWSPDGRRLASINHDKTVSVWDATERTDADRRSEAEARAFPWHLGEYDRAVRGRDGRAAAFHLAELRRAEPVSDLTRAEWGDHFLRRGLWDDALKLLRQIDPKTTALPTLDPWRQRAALHLLTGDADGYRALRSALEERLGGKDRDSRYCLARVLLMTEDRVATAEELARGLLANREIPDPGLSNTRALVSLRAGRHEEAVRLAKATDEKKQAPGYLLNVAVRAAGSARRGEVAAARQELTVAREWLGERKPSEARETYWDTTSADWLEFLLLTREAESLLK